MDDPGVGLVDPVFDSQAIFRSVLDAMARPGTIQKPSGLPDGDGLVGVALMVLDHDTPVWMGKGAEGLRQRLTFHCGCPIIDDPSQAAFALLTDPTELERLDRFAQGEPQYPDRSTTLICALPSLEGGPDLHLSGPGIDGTLAFAPASLPDGFADQWAMNHAQYPLGIDLILTAGSALAALPRTCRLEV